MSMTLKATAPIGHLQKPVAPAVTMQVIIWHNGTLLETVINRPLLVGRGVPGSPVDIDLNMCQGHILGVSRNHMVIEPMNGRIVARDLNSANGSKVNGSKMQPMVNYVVKNGDQLQIGMMYLEVYFK